MQARQLAVLLVMVAGGLVHAPGALADSCTYDATTRTVNVVHDQGFGMSLSRQGSRIEANSFSAGVLVCGDATVRTTDQIVFQDTSVGGGFNGIDLSGGQLAPGATPEPTGKPEIEITFTGDGSELQIIGRPTHRNRITVGSGGFGDPTRGLINIDGDDDADVTYSGVLGQALLVFGGAERDYLSADGARGTGGPATTGVLLRGAPNPTDASAGDQLTAGAGHDVLQGAAGNDSLRSPEGGATLDGEGGHDVLLSSNGVADTLDGGDGPDVAIADCPLDTISNVESTTCQ